MNQQEIWLEHTANLTVENIINEYKNPAIFQIQLTDLINSYASDEQSVIEVGCEIGAVSYLINKKLNKALLDLNPDAIKKAKDAFHKLKNKAEFFTQDMFDMQFSDNTFDIVFNSGVSSVRLI